LCKPTSYGHIGTTHACWILCANRSSPKTRDRINLQGSHSYIIVQERDVNICDANYLTGFYYVYMVLCKCYRQPTQAFTIRAFKQSWLRTYESKTNYAVIVILNLCHTSDPPWLRTGAMLILKSLSYDAYIQTYIPLTLYSRRGSRSISDVPPRRLRFIKII
jgi:hypothetical protein